MIADNDQTVIDLLRTDLTLEGYRVLATATNGEAAAAACAKHHPDVLIVDYRMPPGANGLETIAIVRAADSAAAIVLYSNYLSSSLSSQARRHGAVLVRKGLLQPLRDALAQLTTPPDGDRRTQ